MKHINDQDYKQLLEKLFQATDPKGIAVLLIACSGGRANEILRLTGRNIEVNSRKIAINIIASKLGKSRWITLPDRALAPVKVLQEKLQKRETTLACLVNDSSHSIPTAYRAILRYFNTMQISIFGEKRYALHSWRHALATRAFKNHKDIMAVRTILGHRSLDSTMHYLTAFESEAALEEVKDLVEGNV